MLPNKMVAMAQLVEPSPTMPEILSSNPIMGGKICLWQIALGKAKNI